jgi:hypothetical protein
VPRPGSISSVNADGPERYWTVQEIAELLKFSEDTIRRLFCNEPGVIHFQRRSHLRRRSYETLRIPDSVLRRVVGKLSVVTPVH